jgi:Flp pilus assembly pilin Flp
MILRKRISLTAQSGQTMAEYAVVLSVIILAVITSLTLFSGEVGAAITAVAEMVESVS